VFILLALAVCVALAIPRPIPFPIAQEGRYAVPLQQQKGENMETANFMWGK